MKKGSTKLESIALAKEVAKAALEIKAEDLIILDVRELTSFTSCFVICSGRSDRQVRSIADSVREILGKKGRKPIGSEGYEGGSWVLVDFGDVIAHVFQEETREHYKLERLWVDAKKVKFKV